MKVSEFINALARLGVDHYTGVPDSQLAALCNYLIREHGLRAEKHIVAVNEGGAVALAAGHYLATGKPGMVYLQNSGIGNTINPICSLVHRDVYQIPMVLVVGWRGQPGTKDEPQHIFQGRVTRELLDCVEVENAVLTAGTTEKGFDEMVARCAACLKNDRQFAFVVSKGAFEEEFKYKETRAYPLSREQALECVVSMDNGHSFYVSTTGKLSRELFELREARKQGHDRDFLTVGSMGHSIMIAQGIAAAKRDKMVFCLDGDGACLMHMGSAAVAASCGSENLIHIIFNNAAHESVGGIPTVAGKIDLTGAAAAFGYKTTCRAVTREEVKAAVQRAIDSTGPHFIEIMVNLDVRKDLGRPTTTPWQNKEAFMERLGREAEE